MKKLSIRRAIERLKNDPVKYEEEKRKDREQKKKHRLSIQDQTERKQGKMRKNEVNILRTTGREKTIK